MIEGEMSDLSARRSERHATRPAPDAVVYKYQYYECNQYHDFERHQYQHQLHQHFCPRSHSRTSDHLFYYHSRLWRWLCFLGAKMRYHGGSVHAI